MHRQVMPARSLSICLFCGSRTGDAPAFAAEARRLGRLVAERGHRLVYGAGSCGLMGEAARAAQAAGGIVTGVIPRHLVDLEVGKSDLDDCIVTETMHERKMLMFRRADAVVTLPGGPGTLEELVEALTRRLFAFHALPILLVNVQGYWRPLLALIDHMIAHGLADPSLREHLIPVADAAAAIAEIEARLAREG